MIVMKQMSTGERIRFARKRKCLTQEELGNLIGVKKQTIQKYECGIIETIPNDKVTALCDALDVSEMWLRGFCDDPNGTPTPKKEIKTKKKEDDATMNEIPKKGDIWMIANDRKSISRLAYIVNHNDGYVAFVLLNANEHAKNISVTVNGCQYFICPYKICYKHTDCLTNKIAQLRRNEIDCIDDAICTALGFDAEPADLLGAEAKDNSTAEEILLLKGQVKALKEQCDALLKLLLNK